MEITTKQIQDRVERIQQNIHDRVEAIMDEACKDASKKFSYQDSANVILFQMIAELQLITEKQQELIEELQ